MAPTFLDFGVWNPYGDRGLAARAFGTHAMNADGEWAPKRHKGPGSYRVWLECWGVFEAAAIMLRLATPVTLDRYAKGIATLVDDYPGCWAEVSLAAGLDDLIPML